MWLLLAIGSAISAGLVSVTIKAGMKNVNSNLGTFLRTLIVLIFTFVMVLITGSLEAIYNIESIEWIYIIFSGLCTGFSWLSYYKALQIGDINKVVPVDKMSTVLTMILAVIIFNEPFWWLTFIAITIMVIGTMMMISKGKALSKNNLNEHFTKIPYTQAFQQNRNGSYFQTKPKTKVISQNNDKITKHNDNNNLWFVYALLSMVFASFTSILAKLGMQSVDSNLGTFLRTIVVAVMAFIIVFRDKKFTEIKKMTKQNWLYLIISGCFTGISWLCYYGAIQTGIISVVVPIDKLSVIVAVTCSYFMFKERLNLRAIVGLILLTSGTLLLLIKPM